MPSTEWKEIIAPDEQERFARYGEQIAEIQRRRAKGGAQLRGFHPKALLAARAEFTVLPDLPAHARQGLFAEPRTYEAWVRYSNGAIAVQSDQRGDVRGMVVKLLGVSGKKIIPSKIDAQTQDFSMIYVPVLVFKDADEFMWFVDAGRKPATLLPRMIGRFGLGRTLRILASLPKGLTRAVRTLAAEPFYNPMPVQFGPYAVHYSVRPVAPPPLPPRSRSPNYLGEDLAKRLREGPMVYDFAVQFYEDAVSTPIEDTTVEWKTPWLTVGRLALPQQDVASEAGRALAARIEAHQFNPWHALEAHRPLGNMMRARSPTYKVSTENRGATAEP